MTRPEDDDATSAAGEAEQDQKDLHRGAAVNAVGLVFKAATPVLFILMTRAYGEAAYGAFAAAQAIAIVVSKAATLGMDKALLWWIPRQPEGQALRALTSAGTVAFLGNLVAALGLFALTFVDLSPWFAWPEAMRVQLRYLTVAMPFLALIEIFAHSAMGKRRMEAQVFIKDLFFPVCFLALALAIWAVTQNPAGCALGFVIASVVTTPVIYLVFRRFSRGDALGPIEKLPKEFRRYAGPMWLADTAASNLNQLDVFALTFLTGNMELVGIYKAASWIANQLRSVRRAFDPILLAIVSEIGAKKAYDRLGAGLTRATSLVMWVQIPAAFVVCVFADDLLLVFGEGFASGATALRILCVGWVVSCWLALSGVVISALGYARVALVNTLLTSALQLALLAVLVPAYSLNGAAIAAVGSLIGLGVVQAVEMRVITGGFHYQRSLWKPAFFGTLAAAVGTLMVLWEVGGGWSKAVATAAFVALYAPGAVRVVWPRARPRSKSSDAPAEGS
ncbi:MAG: polysaccharide biosynthesis C-terminal domain-containing protein [Myxococcota bacterium]